MCSKTPEPREPQRCMCTDVKPCRGNQTRSNLFLENIADVANSICEVMKICGIHICKATGAIKTVRATFLYYDELRHKLNEPPGNALCKQQLMEDLQKRALMTSLESQLSYYIIKQAFKAFHHGMLNKAIRSPIFDADKFICQGPIWAHAASRTSQIFAKYAEVFPASKANYAQLIKCEYMALFGKLRTRSVLLERLHICPCTAERLKRSTAEKESGHVDTCKPQGEEITAATCGLPVNSSKDTTQNWKKEGMYWQRCPKCDYPELLCDCEVDPILGHVGPDYGQHPFKCQWVLLEQKTNDDCEEERGEEEESTICKKVTAIHECPIECDSQSSRSGSNISSSCEECSCGEANSTDEEDEGNEKNENECKECQACKHRNNRVINCRLLNHLRQYILTNEEFCSCGKQPDKVAVQDINNVTKPNCANLKNNGKSQANKKRLAGIKKIGNKKGKGGVARSKK